jgi:hypothetical protein
MDLMLWGVWWVWWATGTFGLVTTAIIIWFAPTVALTVARVALTFLFTNRWGNMIAVAIVVFFVADVNRSIRDADEYQQKTAAFEQEQKDRDARIATETREAVTKEIAEQTAANTATDKQVEDFRNALPPPPVDAPNPYLVGNDACRLRALAGQSGCGPRSVVKGVPKARAPGKGGGNHRKLGLSGSVRHILGRDQKGS